MQLSYFLSYKDWYDILLTAIITFMMVECPNLSNFSQQKKKSAFLWICCSWHIGLHFSLEGRCYWACSTQSICSSFFCAVYHNKHYLKLLKIVSLWFLISSPFLSNLFSRIGEKILKKYWYEHMLPRLFLLIWEKFK